jgi:N-acetylglucosamine repressor
MMKKATHQLTKAHNTTLVLKTIYKNDGVSRAEIARITGLTRTTVSDIVADLQSAGLAHDAGFGYSAAGKPPILVKITGSSRQIMCIDTSEKIFAGALIDLNGEMVFKETIHLPDPLGPVSLETVYHLLDRLKAKATAPILGLGIGIPGIVNTQEGVVLQAVHRGWRDLPMKQLLAAHCDFPIYVANDSNIAALAELTYGEHRQAANLFLLKIGEGIGSGLVLGGKIHEGETYSAGEIGHLSVVPDGAACNCGNRGCLETVARAQILAEASKHFAKVHLELPDEIRNAADPIPGLIKLFHQSDADARAIVFSAARHIAGALASVIGLLDIHKLLIAGVYAPFGQPFLDAVGAELKRRVLSAQSKDINIHFTTYGDDIVLRGAAALVLQQELGLP